MSQDNTGNKEKLEKINKYISMYELKLEDIEPRIIQMKSIKSVYSKKMIKCGNSSDYRIAEPLANAKFYLFLNKIDSMLSALRIKKELYLLYLIMARIQKNKLESESDK